MLLIGLKNKILTTTHDPLPHQLNPHRQFMSENKIQYRKSPGGRSFWKIAEDGTITHALLMEKWVLVERGQNPIRLSDLIGVDGRLNTLEATQAEFETAFKNAFDELTLRKIV